MDKLTFKNLLQESGKQLRAGSLRAALQTMNTLAGLMANSEIAARIYNIERAYSALLTYFRSGAVDKGREEMYTRFLSDADAIYRELMRQFLIVHTDTAYAKAHQVLREMGQSDEPFAETAFHSQLMQTLFERIWVSEPFTDAVTQAVLCFMNDAMAEVERKQMIVSALTLSSLEVFDAQKTLLLITLSRHDDVFVRSRAMMGMAFVFMKYANNIERYPNLTNAIRIAYEDTSARRELAELQMQLLLSLEAKQIAQSLREEILPEMLKETGGKMPTDKETLTRLNAEMSELGLNPEWEKDAKRSEIGKKIHRMIEMQQKGADVYLSSFSMLKGRFSFFRKAVNWFLPFSADNLEVQLDEPRKAFIALLDKFGMLCDSDKYSMSLLIAQMPASQFALIQTQIQSMLPDEKDIVQPELTFTTALRTCLQDYYRFATLFHHGDARLNPFNRSLLFIGMSPFKAIIGTGEMLQQIANFAFDEKNYTIALPLIEQLIDEEPTARLWQMAGYSYQCLGDFEKAVTAYERSELFGEPSAWTIRQLAACHRAAGHYEKALAYYDQMDAEQGSKVGILIRRAQCLENMGRIDECVEMLYQVDYLEEEPGEGAQALLKVLFHAARFKDAIRTGERILAANPTMTDRLLTAHATWLAGDTAEAIARYKGYFSRIDDTLKAEKPVEALLFENERDFLLQNGKTQVDLQIMADAIAEI